MGDVNPPSLPIITNPARGIHIPRSSMVPFMAVGGLIPAQPVAHAEFIAVAFVQAPGDSSPTGSLTEGIGSTA